MKFSKTNILFFDKEGGFGGSSRSLYLLVKNLSKYRINPFVLLRERGPVFELYRNQNIKVFVNNKMPVYKPSRRKNVLILILFLFQVPFFISTLVYMRKLLQDLKIDIIHMNHDSFFVYAPFFKNFISVKIVVHMRTMLPKNVFSYLQAKFIDKIADWLIFISENELKRFSSLVGHYPKNFSIVFNCAESRELAETSNPCISKICEGRFKVLFLGNLNTEKGAGRLISIAKELASRGEHHILFIICGEDRQNRGNEGIQSWKSKAEAESVSEYFYFAGYQPHPENFIRYSHILIRLSKNEDPWGRDIIEAMSQGKPVLATGTYDKFVQPGTNGFLLYPFKAKEAADRILELMYDSELRREMGSAGLSRAKMLFDVNKHTRSVEKIYESLCGE